MYTRYKHTQVYRKAFFFMFLVSVSCFLLLHRPEKTTQRPTRDATASPSEFRKTPLLSETPRFIKTEGIPPLSPQETHLLEQLKTEVTAYNTKVKSGEIEFSVTVSRIAPQETKHLFVELFEAVRDTLIPKKQKDGDAPPTYEETGHWDITYRFNGETEFFDVKARAKRDMNGSVIVTRTENGGLRHDIWQETHYQFLRHRKQTLYIREGTKWRPYDKWQQSLPVWIPTNVFDKCFNPLWWCLGDDESFDRFIHRHKIIGVKQVENKGSSQFYLRLYHAEAENINTPVASATTHEIWMHPKEGIYPKHILIANRRAQLQPELEIVENFFSIAEAKPVPGKYYYSETIRFQSLTSEIAEYEPGIFFPKIVTEEDYSEDSMSEIFPNRSNSEFPVIIHEALLPEWFREEYQKAPRLRRVMNVHRAVFNIPMELDIQPTPR